MERGGIGKEAACAVSECVYLTAPGQPKVFAKHAQAEVKSQETATISTARISKPDRHVLDLRIIDLVDISNHGGTACDARRAQGTQWLGHLSSNVDGEVSWLLGDRGPGKTEADREVAPTCSFPAAAIRHSSSGI